MNADIPPPRLPGVQHFDRCSAEARPLALALCRAAVAGWRAASALRLEGQRRYETSPSGPAAGLTPEVREWETWLNTAVAFEGEAARRVAACLLLLHGLVKNPKDVAGLPAGWRPIGLELDGAHYVVHPGDDDSGRPRVVVVEGPDFDSCQFGQPDWEVGR